MKNIIILLIAILGFTEIYAQDSQCSPCNMDNQIEVMSAIAQQHRNPIDVISEVPITATAALIAAGLQVYSAAPDAEYCLKVTAGGESKYSSGISSCQYALEYTYDILRMQGVQAVRIISKSYTVNVSCRNKTYTPRDLRDVKYRRDNYGSERLLDRL